MLLRRGFVKDGIRYKTLHEILKGTFKIAKEEADAMEVRMRGLAPSTEQSSLDAAASTDAGAKRPDVSADTASPWIGELDQAEPGDGTILVVLRRWP